MSREPSEFIHLPALRPPEKPGGNWVLAEDWTSPPLGGIRVEIKAGFQTDGASIPRIAWRAIGHPFQVPLLGPALCHDAIYAAELVPTHAEADDMFLDWMEKARINWAKRNTVWLAVRCFGGMVWSRHTPASVANARGFVSLTQNCRRWR